MTVFDKMAVPDQAKPTLKVLLCSPRGFCAGVVRAIDTVERALAIYGAPVYVRHEIVHNRYVVETLKRKGAFLALSWPRDAMAKTTLVEIRSSNGLNIARTAKRPALRLKAPPAGTRLTITLTATSRTGVLGRPGRFSRTLPKHKATKKPKTHRKAAQHR